MRLRRDALLAAARMVQAVNTVARDHAPDAVGTVGLIESRPNSRNVVPGDVFLTIDLRHPDDSVVARMDQQMRAALDGIAADAGVSVSVDCVLDAPAVTFDAQCVDAVERAAAMQGLSARRITSGAGHDAANLSAVAPTAMIFVPCEGGISHNELEKAEPEHVAAGANVLLHAVLETDARLAVRSDAGGK
jgi:N-carbamoyl-L-amino-acid hydrolase